MTTLPPFSGDLPTCTKCGAVGATTQYRSFGECIHAPGSDEVIGFEPNDRLHRECARCGHQWDEAVVPPASTVKIHMSPDTPPVAEAIRDIRHFGPGGTR